MSVQKGDQVHWIAHLPTMANGEWRMANGEWRSSLSRKQGRAAISGTLRANNEPMP